MRTKERITGIKFFKVRDSFLIEIPFKKYTSKFELLPKGVFHNEICVMENGEEICEPMGLADETDLYYELLAYYEEKKNQKA